MFYEWISKIYLHLLHVELITCEAVFIHRTEQKMDFVY